MADELLRRLSVVEFYSGIGGMHFALKGCSFPSKVVTAMEINTTANQVYKQNFGDTKLLQKNIEGLTVQEIDNLSADVFVMSPPCQPFTRVGLQGASKDPRTRSFLHILELLPELSRPPDYILMENVKGFETSDTRERFVGTLKSCGYSFQEFLLSPTQFGIPNSRLRYYLVAKKKPLQFYFPTRDEIMDSLPYSCTTPRRLNKTIHSTTDHTCAMRPRCETTDTKATNDRQSPEEEISVNSSHRGKHNLVCLKCLQLRTGSSSSAEDSTNNSVWESFKVTNCTRIRDYLEKGKDENYFEEFMLP